MKSKYIEALLDMAERFGQTSTAKRLKVGAIIWKNDSCIALGVNGMPPAWPTEVCETSDNKTKPECRHAEDAALQKLWNSSETASGAIMFVSHSPCLSCSIKIKTAGINKVFYRHNYRDSDGVDYLINQGIEVLQIKKEEIPVPVVKNIKPTHIVKYFESERGWGGEIWYRRFDSKEEADAAITSCNILLPNEVAAPDYYIVASYVGIDLINNSKYDATYKH